MIGQQLFRKGTDSVIVINWKECVFTACEIWSPDRVTTHFSWSWGIVNRNLSCFRPSLPYNGTGNRWAHS